MPLNRANVTAASRVMLPVYAAFFCVVGLSFTTTPLVRLVETPALAYADDLLPIRAWGLLFVATGLGMAAALTGQRRTGYRFALWVGIILMGTWSTVLAGAALFSVASPSAWAWPAFVCAACVASDRSLRRGEV